MTDGSDRLSRGLLRLGEIVCQEPMRHRRVDHLDNALFVAAGEKDEVVLIEGEAAVCPGEGFHVLHVCLHGVVEIDGFGGSTLWR